MNYRRKYYWKNSHFLNFTGCNVIQKFLEVNEDLFFIKFPYNFSINYHNQKISKKMIKFGFVYGLIVFFDLEYTKIYISNFIFKIEFVKNKIVNNICKLSKKHSFLISLGSIKEFLVMRPSLV